ncbi:MAG: protein translocase SEC61 complex subunit gamma [Nanoarchaeota archaeon]
MRIINWLHSQYQKNLRVWKLLRRPTMEEFKLVSKVSFLGLLIIGGLGFLISVLMKLIF